MDEAQFYRSLDMLREDVSSRGAAIVVTESSPASASAITECSTRLGVTLPGELISFLRRRNGLSISYYERAAISDKMSNACSERFEIQGTTGITLLTLGLRDFFGDVAEESPELSKACARVGGMVALSTDSDISTYVRIDDRPLTSDTCPVRVLDQQRFSDWLMAPERPIIASSIADHVLMSIQALITTKDTFMYWL